MRLANRLGKLEMRAGDVLNAKVYVLLRSGQSLGEAVRRLGVASDDPRVVCIHLDTLYERIEQAVKFGFPTNVRLTEPAPFRDPRELSTRELEIELFEMFAALDAQGVQQ